MRRVPCMIDFIYDIYDVGDRLGDVLADKEMIRIKNKSIWCAVSERCLFYLMLEPPQTFSSLCRQVKAVSIINPSNMPMLSIRTVRFHHISCKDEQAVVRPTAKRPVIHMLCSRFTLAGHLLSLLVARW